MTTTRKYFIYSPALDQAKSIAYLLKKYYPSTEIIGLQMEKEQIRLKPHYFDQIRHINTIGTLNLEGIHIPTGATSTKWLLESKGDIKIGSIKHLKSNLRVFDKPQMIELARELGIPVPQTWQTASEIPSFPVFYKQRYETGGGLRGIARSALELPRGYQNNLIYQELIPSQGTYGVAFLADEGRLLVTHTHFERESSPREGGSAVVIESFSDSRLINHTRALIESLAYSGWGLAEFKYSAELNDYLLMEVNAKFWASCEFTFVNEPLFLKLLFDIDSHEKPIDRMVFLERAFARGMPFILSNIRLLRSSKVKLYPGWWLRVGNMFARNLIGYTTKILGGEN
ncbi:MAG: hypothetical protein QXI70_06095 [Methanothrix sp.]